MPTGTDLLTYIKDHYEKPFRVNSSHVNAAKKLLSQMSDEIMTVPAIINFFACFEQTLIKNAEDPNTKTLNLLEKILNEYFAGITLEDIRWLQKNLSSTNANWNFIQACVHRDRALGWLKCLHDRYGINMQHSTLPQALRNALITHINNAEEPSNKDIQKVLITEITTNIQSNNYTFFTDNSPFSPAIRGIIKLLVECDSPNMTYQRTKNPREISDAVLIHWPELKKLTPTISLNDLLKLLVMCESPADIPTNNIVHLFSLYQNNFSKSIELWNAETLAIALKDPYFNQLKFVYLSIFRQYYCSAENWQLTQCCSSPDDRKKILTCFSDLEQQYGMILSNPLRHPSSYLFELSLDDLKALKQFIANNINDHITQEKWIFTNLFSSMSEELFTIARDAKVLGKFYHAHDKAQMADCFSLLHSKNRLKQTNIINILADVHKLDSSLNLKTLTPILIHLVELNIINPQDYEDTVENLAINRSNGFTAMYRRILFHVDSSNVKRVLMADNGKYWPLFESESPLNIFQRMRSWGIDTNENIHRLFSAPTSTLDKLLMAETQPKHSEKSQLFFDNLLSPPHTERSMLKPRIEYIHQPQPVRHSYDGPLFKEDWIYLARLATQKFNEQKKNNSQKKITSEPDPQEKKLSFFPEVDSHSFDVYAPAKENEAKTTEILHDKRSKKVLDQLPGPRYKRCR